MTRAGRGLRGALAAATVWAVLACPAIAQDRGTDVPLTVDPPAAAPEPPGRDDERLGRDPFGSMGGGSPMCRRADLGAVERANCRDSGALAHPVRIDHYGFDIHIDTGLDNVTGNFAKGLQDIAQTLWLVLLYAIKAVTLGLEWAFSLDLLGKTMSGTRSALERMHRQIVADGWLIAAISVAGVWAIYRGLVQRRTTDAIAGLAATVLLMAAGMVVVSEPADTIGRASQLANQAALGIVAGATTASTSQPARGFGQAMTRVFQETVLRPWCALQFSDVRFCLSSPRSVIDPDDLPDDDKVRDAYASASTVAELFLAFEPNGDQRDAIYEEWKSKEGDRLQAVVRIQKEPSTGPRLALLAVIAIGQIGMILVLGWLTIRLLGYGGLAVALLLAAPIVLLAPALGDAGRRAFATWAKRLTGALVAKAVYACLLAVVLLTTGALAELDSLGWMAVWLLQAVVWWTLFLRRDEILSLVTAREPAQPPRSLIQRAFYAHRVASTAAQAVAAPKAALARQTVGRIRDRQTATRQAVQTTAKAQLHRQADRDLGTRHAEAKDTLIRHRETQHDLARVNGALAGYDQRAGTARRNGDPPPKPTTRDTYLLAHREHLAESRPSAREVDRAREFVRHADANEARGEPAVADADRVAYIRRRRREIAELAVDHPNNLRAAGISPDAYRTATGPARDRLKSKAERALAAESARLAAVGDGSSQPTQTEIAKARATLARPEVRAARREQTRALRNQRRQHRGGPTRRETQ